MKEEFPIHLIGGICWLPPEKSNQKIKPPNTVFRALGKFTSNLIISTTVLVNYSPIALSESWRCYKVRLNFAFLSQNEVERLMINTEVLIMDGYKVIAICRNIRRPILENSKMDDEWVSK
jgi:hypothetical protein